MAEATAREVCRLALDDALDLVVLVAEKDPRRFDAFALRWVARLVAERPARLADLDLAVAALRALPDADAITILRRLAVRPA